MFAIVWSQHEWIGEVGVVTTPCSTSNCYGVNLADDGRHVAVRACNMPYLLEVVLRILLPVLPPDLGAQLTCQSIYTTNERSYPGNPGELQLE